jgi:hypothetical protein
MPEKALHHMDRHPVVEQLCRSCVAQPMSLAEPQRISRSICQSVQFVELGQRHVVAGVGAGTSPGQVLLDPDEQILRLQVRVGVGQPALLLADYVDHRLLHQDGRNHTVDLMSSHSTPWWRTDQTRTWMCSVRLWHGLA